MILYKFGGASVRNAESVKKLAEIVKICREPLVIVISAMGKTTNRLETILDKALKNSPAFGTSLDELQNEHLEIINGLHLIKDYALIEEVKNIFTRIRKFIEQNRGKDYNFQYDQVVSQGELLSTKIVSAFLAQEKTANKWIDSRELIRTNDNYRDASVDHELSGQACKSLFDFTTHPCYITQGFIGSDGNGNTTTLGREGSDYTAALIANYLNASAITLWKDVPGIFNADPARFEQVQQIPSLSYHEVVELTYYGAKVIHPKTIKPLYEKEIPLYVKSFNDPEKTGTLVGKASVLTREIPFIIEKEQQVLISISNKDLSFVSEKNVSELFSLLNDFRLKANLMQHSAISFSVSVDTPKGKEISDLISSLKENFKVLYNQGLQLITIRNYTEELIEKLVKGRKVLVEQRSRHTVQFLLA